jgi:hypothetical protein
VCLDPHHASGAAAQAKLCCHRTSMHFKCCVCKQGFGLAVALAAVACTPAALHRAVWTVCHTGRAAVERAAPSERPCNPPRTGSGAAGKRCFVPTGAVSCVHSCAPAPTERGFGRLTGRAAWLAVVGAARLTSSVALSDSAACEFRPPGVALWPVIISEGMWQECSSSSAAGCMQFDARAVHGYVSSCSGMGLQNSCALLQPPSRFAHAACDKCS